MSVTVVEDKVSEPPQSRLGSRRLALHHAVAQFLQGGVGEGDDGVGEAGRTGVEVGVAALEGPSVYVRTAVWGARNTFYALVSILLPWPRRCRSHSRRSIAVFQIGVPEPRSCGRSAGRDG